MKKLGKKLISSKDTFESYDCLWNYCANSVGCGEEYIYCQIGDTFSRNFNVEAHMYDLDPTMINKLARTK